jgi:hypothetical protein
VVKYCQWRNRSTADYGSLRSGAGHPNRSDFWVGRIAGFRKPPALASFPTGGLIHQRIFMWRLSAESRFFNFRGHG